MKSQPTASTPPQGMEPVADDEQNPGEAGAAQPQRSPEELAAAERAASAPPEALSSEPIHISRIAPSDEADVDRFVASCGRTCFWHQRAWMRAVESTFAMPEFTLVARRAGEVVGLLPLSKTETLSLGQNLVSVPFGVYGGVAGVDRAVEDALIREVKVLAIAEKAGYVELRHRDARCTEFPESSLYVTFEKELPSKPEDALTMLPRKARAAARQGRDKFGLTFDEGLWFLDDFYTLFSRNKRHLGSPPLPKQFFEALVDELKGDIFLHVVRKGSKPIAGVLSFRFKSALLPYYSGGLSEFESLQCNNFLYWKLMEWGVERGFKSFDFGRSRRDTGPYHFKKNQGFEPKGLHYGYHLVNARKLPQMNPGNPAFDLPRRVWQRLPLSIHEMLGARLSRYLP